MKLLSEREPRKFQTLTDTLKIRQLVEKYFIQRPYFLKGYNGVFIKGEQITPDGRVVVDTKANINDEIIAYNVLKKYIELKGTVDQHLSPEKYLLDIHTVNIAVEERKSPRFNVDFGSVYVTNFRASRNAINASLFNIPTSVKVHLKQYQQILSGMADEVVVDVFDKSLEKLDLVRKTGKILYIRDTSNEGSYEMDDDERFINYSRSTFLEIPQVIRDYKMHKVVSELIVPVVYTGHDGVDIPLGYIQLTSKTKLIGKEKAEELLKVAQEIVQKMRDSNTVLINDRQKIENLSVEGMAIRLSNEELKKLVPEQSGLTFDVVFKMTQPITLSTEIVYTGFDERDIIIGLRIVGYSTKSGDSSRYSQMVSMFG